MLTLNREVQVVASALARQEQAQIPEVALPPEWTLDNREVDLVTPVPCWGQVGVRGWY